MPFHFVRYTYSCRPIHMFIPFGMNACIGRYERMMTMYRLIRKKQTNGGCGANIVVTYTANILI